MISLFEGYLLIIVIYTLIKLSQKTYLFDVIWHDLSVTVDIMCLQFGHDVLQHCYKVLILKVILVK